MKLYIYKDKELIKERLVLPSQSILTFEFPAIINAFMGMPQNLLNYDLSELIRMFYENLSPDILEWLHFETQMREELTIEMSRPEDFETFIEYHDFLDVMPGNLYGRSANLESFLLECISVSDATQLWLKKSGRKKPSERFMYPNKFTQRLSDSMNIDVSVSMSYKAMNEAIKDPKFAEELAYIQNISQRKSRELIGIYMTLYKSYETRNQQFHTSIAGLSTERKKIRSSEKVKTKTDETEIQSDYEVVKILSRAYTSEQGLLPLLWAEIEYAVENNLYLRKCSTCKRWFVQNSRQRFCSDRCRSKFITLYDRLRQRKKTAKSEEGKHMIQELVDTLLKDKGSEENKRIIQEEINTLLKGKGDE